MSQVVSISQDGKTRRWLGHIGHVSNLVYSFTCPGGPDQMTCTLNRTSRYRTDAFNEGRIIQVLRGGSVIWDGQLDEPDGTSGVFQISAHGAGTFGADFVSEWTGAWSGALDSAINRAITRGLRWVNPGVGSPTGIWLGQQVDSGMQFITDHLNLACSKGSLTWYVNCRPRGNVLSVFPLPLASTAVPGRLLVSTVPALRTLYGSVNRVWERYQTSADARTGPAVFALTSTDEPASIALHGPHEQPADLSSAGNLTAGQAQAVGRLVLNRYQRANFGSGFPVTWGSLLTMGGHPVDPGMNQAANVYRIVLTETGFGGELVPGPINVLGGEYVWDDHNQAGLMTPFQSNRHDFSTLLGLATPAARPSRVRS